MQDSKIEWTHHTGNIWEGCVEVHEGCDNCYARVLNHRWGKQNWGNDVPRRMSKSFFINMAKFQKLAKEANETHRVFVGSMMDIFEKPMPLIDSKGNLISNTTTGDLRSTFFTSVSMGEYPNLMFLLLTKRPSNINKYIPEGWKTNPPANVMFGTSPVNMETFNKLVGQLLEVNGKRFLSIEPQLGLIDFNLSKFSTDYLSVHIDWIIQGGESGHHKRPFNLEWAYRMKAQCATYGIPYFFKQIDKVQQIPEDLMIRQFPVAAS